MAIKKNAKITAAGVALAVVLTPALSNAAFAEDSVPEVEAVATEAVIDTAEVEVVEEVAPEVEAVEEDAATEVVEDVVEPEAVVEEAAPVAEVFAAEDAVEDEEVADPVALTAPSFTTSVNGAFGITISGFGHDSVDPYWGEFTHYTINVGGRAYETAGEDVVVTGLDPDTDYTVEVFYGTTFGETSPRVTTTVVTEGEDLEAPYMEAMVITDSFIKVGSIGTVYERWHGKMTGWTYTFVDAETGEEIITYTVGAGDNYQLAGLKADHDYTVSVFFTTENGFVSPVTTETYHTLVKDDSGNGDGGENPGGGNEGGENPGGGNEGGDTGGGDNGGENPGNGGTDNGGNTGTENPGNGGNTGGKGDNAGTGNITGGAGNGVTLLDAAGDAGSADAETAVESADAHLAYTGAGNGASAAVAGIMLMLGGAFAMTRRARKNVA